MSATAGRLHPALLPSAEDYGAATHCLNGKRIAGLCRLSLAPPMVRSDRQAGAPATTRWWRALFSSRRLLRALLGQFPHGVVGLRDAKHHALGFRVFETLLLVWGN